MRERRNEKTASEILFGERRIYGDRRSPYLNSYLKGRDRRQGERRNDGDDEFGI